MDGGGGGGGGGGTPSMVVGAGRGGEFEELVGKAKE